MSIVEYYGNISPQGVIKYWMKKTKWECAREILRFCNKIEELEKALSEAGGKAALTQQQDVAQRLSERLALYLAGECACPDIDVERTKHYSGCPKQRREAEPVGKAATYYAISSGDHVQFDTNTGQLEIYETEEEAMLNCSISLGVIAVDVRRHPPKPAAQPQVPEGIVEKYNELIYHVASKFPNESRHETALRYIKNAESCDAAQTEATEEGK